MAMEFVFWLQELAAGEVVGQSSAFMCGLAIIDLYTQSLGRQTDIQTYAQSELIMWWWLLWGPIKEERSMS